VVVAFHSSETNPFISFSYLMSDFWDYTAGDQDLFNSEINSVVASLNVNTSVIEMKSAADTVSQESQAYIKELRGLAKLRDDGVISTSEFEFKKRSLIGI
jgi:hypothetical protein